MKIIIVIILLICFMVYCPEVFYVLLGIIAIERIIKRTNFSDLE